MVVAGGLGPPPNPPFLEFPAGLTAATGYHESQFETKLLPTLGPVWQVNTSLVGYSDTAYSNIHLR